jgi:superfamily II DNA or RNA helicase
VFSTVKRFVGSISVHEVHDQIVVEGLPAMTVSRDIRDIWSTSKIGQHMFTKYDRSSLTFNKFFAPDVVYTLEQVLAQRVHPVRNYRALQRTVDLIYQNTWMRSVKQEHPDILDFSQLDQLTVDLLPKQWEFLRTYNEKVSQYGLGGYLLGAVPGSGKTIGCLAISLCSKADVTIAIVPKNAVIDVWEKTLREKFKKPPTYWHSLSGEELRPGKKYYIFHYEQLDRAVAFAQLLYSQRMALNPCVLLDESHNLNEMDSARSKLFVEMCRVLEPKHIVWSSGTPLKALGKEVVPLLMTIDKLFDDDARERFLAIFGKNSARANDILRNRMGMLTFQVEKKDVVDNKTQTFERKVVLPNGRDYTLDTIREEMRSFILQRMAYYEEHMDLFIEVYMDALKVFEVTLHSEESRKQYRTYRSFIDAIRGGYDPATMKDMVVFCNKYEKGVIAPTLPRDLKHQFLDARSVVKYYELKVQGEALGRVLGRKRAQCHVDMVPLMGLPDLIDASLSKTIIFTSYVAVVKAMETYLRGEGYEPLVVYGETNHELPAIMERFKRQERADPLLATYDSLSTAVPVVEASTAILTNAPFRDYEYEQATSRIDRLDQQHQCTIWNVYLDTGTQPNISTRSKDIMQWSREQVEQIMGKKSLDPSIAIEEFPVLTGFTAAELKGKPRFLSW